MLSNQTLTILIILGVLMTLTGLLLSSFTTVDDSDFLVNVGIWLIEVAGMFLLLHNGTFLKTKYSRIVMGLIAYILIRIVFKLMHWPYKTEMDILFVLSVIVIVILYGIHFFKKPIKKRLDYLKLAWVSILYIGAVLKLYHLIPRDYRILTTVLMILAIMDYILPKIKNKTLFE